MLVVKDGAVCLMLQNVSGEWVYITEKAWAKMTDEEKANYKK